MGQAAAGLVHGNRRHIGPGFHGGHGQLIAEVKVGAVGLVGQAEHPVFVGHLGNGLDIRADAVIGGVVHQHRLGVGVLFDGRLHVLPAHPRGIPSRSSQAGSTYTGTAPHSTMAPMTLRVDVPGQDDLLPPLGHGQNHGLHRRGGAPHHQKGVGGPKGLGGQLLGLPDDGNRVAQVVQGLHGVDVHPTHFCPKSWVSSGLPRPRLWPGTSKGTTRRFSNS